MLTRKIDQRVRINSDIWVQVLGIDLLSHRVKLGFTAPEDFPVVVARLKKQRGMGL